MANGRSASRAMSFGIAATLIVAVTVPPVANTSEAGPAPAPPTVGLVDPSQGQWHLRDAVGDVNSFFFGNPGDSPIMGDWDCNGIDTPGMYRQSDGFVYLSNANQSQVADIRFFFGNPGDVPLAGDFNGDGCDTVSIYRPDEGRFYIINKLGANEGGLGAAEADYLFGNPGDKPFVGDFNGDGVDTVGLHRESTGLVYFRQSHTQGIADAQFIYGDPDDRLVAGDWNNDGTDTPALFRPSNTTFFFRYTNTQGVADASFAFGESDWLPVAGFFGLSPTACDPAYVGVCIPSPPPDLDCGDIAASNFTVLPPDPHGFDLDGNGIGCEGSGPQGDVAYYLEASRQAAETVVGGDGLPVTAFLTLIPLSDPVGLAAGVSVVRCHDAICSRGTEYTVAETPTSPWELPLSASGIDLAIGSDGFPVVVYGFHTKREGATEVLAQAWVTKCADIECKVSTTNEIFSASDGFLFDPKIAIGADGNPIVAIAYTRPYIQTDENSDHLVSVHCLDRSCSATDPVEHDELGDTAGESLDIAVPPDGRPVIAFSNTLVHSDPLTGRVTEETSLKVGRCVDVACSQIDAHLIHPYADLSGEFWNWPVSSPGGTAFGGTVIEVDVGADGLPIVAYIEQFWTSGITSRGNLWLANCLNASCSSSSRQLVDGMDGVLIGGASSEGAVEDMSLAIALDGEVAIAYKAFLVPEVGFAMWGIFVSYCGDERCTDSTRTEVESRGVEIGFDISMIFIDGQHLLTMNGYNPQADIFETEIPGARGPSRPHFYSCVHARCDGELSHYRDFEIVDDSL